MNSQQSKEQSVLSDLTAAYVCSLFMWMADSISSSFLLDIFDVFAFTFWFVSLLSIMALVNILCTWVGSIGKGMAAFILFGLTFFLKILVFLPPPFFFQFLYEIGCDMLIAWDDNWLGITFMLTVNSAVWVSFRFFWMDVSICNLGFWHL